MKKRGSSKRPSRPRSGNLANDTAQRLRAAILRGEFLVGQPLRELELCRQLGVSRVPLREALHRLEGERIVTIRPNRGAEVAVPSQPELREIAEACRLIEGHLLVLAAPAMTVEILDEAEALISGMDQEDRLLEWRHLNWEFHARLYAPAGRPFLIEWVGALRARAELAMTLLVAEKARRLALNEEHRSILEALRRRQPDLAAKRLQAHLEQGKEKVLSLLDRR